MKKVTSVTFWNDAVGKRLSITSVSYTHLTLPTISHV